MPLRLPNWEELSRSEQIPIINLPLNQTYIVTGGPGTGKTICALYRASQLQGTSADIDSSVLFLVYNKTLKLYLLRAIKELELSDSNANNWHKWFYKYYYQSTGERVPGESFNPDWEIVNEKLKDNSSVINHLIIDEAQDLPKGLMELLKRISNQATIFADENQGINKKSTPLAEITNAFDVPGKVYYLSKNFRNTDEIANVSQLFYTGDIGDIPAKANKHGEKPKVLKSGNFDKTISLIADYAEGSLEKNIGVILPPTGRRVTRYYNALNEAVSDATVQLYKYNNSEHFSFDEDGLKVMTNESVKGLEFDTVFIPELDSDYYQDKGEKKVNKMYVCCSRAKGDLILMHETDNNASFALKQIENNKELFSFIDVVQSDSGGEIF